MPPPATASELVSHVAPMVLDLHDGEESEGRRGGHRLPGKECFGVDFQRGTVECEGHSERPVGESDRKQESHARQPDEPRSEAGFHPWNQRHDHQRQHEDAHCERAQFVDHRIECKKRQDCRCTRNDPDQDHQPGVERTKKLPWIPVRMFQGRSQVIGVEGTTAFRAGILLELSKQIAAAPAVAVVFFQMIDQAAPSSFRCRLKKSRVRRHP